MANLNKFSIAVVNDKRLNSQMANTSDQFDTQLGAQAMPKISFVTLKPYNSMLGNRNKNSMRKPHQAFKEHLLLDKIFAPDYYKKFYIVKAISKINLWFI